jgi:hypothetical protein
MATRQEVYAAVDSERAYQDQLARNTEQHQSPLEFIAVIEHIIHDMKEKYYDKPGAADINFMRKIAGVAVRAMEDHGAPRREGF